MILPRKTVLELQRLLDDADERRSRCDFASNQAKFTFGGMEFVTKLVEGKFPDYNRVIPKDHKNSVTLGRAPLLRQPAARRDPDQREVQGRAPATSSRARCASRRPTPSRKRRKEELEIDYGGDAIEIGFNVTYLIDALANMKPGHGERSSCGDANSRALVTIPENADFKYVVMPMRI